MTRITSCKSTECGCNKDGKCSSQAVGLYISECESFLVCEQAKEYFTNIKEMRDDRFGASGFTLKLVENEQVLCGDYNCANYSQGECDLEEIELLCDNKWYLTCLYWTPVME